MKTNIDFITLEKMKTVVAGVRSRYIQLYGNQLPFKAETFLEEEFGMKIIPLPGLRTLEVECAFAKSGDALLVDKDDYERPTSSNRLAFTFAHELGHKVLHEKYIVAAEGLSARDLDKIEMQARMFAAEFLMPEHLVLGVIATEILDKIDGIVDQDLTIEACVEYRITEIAAYFGTSVGAMRNRLKNMNIASVLSGPYISRQDVGTLRELSSKIKTVRTLTRHTVLSST